MTTDLLGRIWYEEEVVGWQGVWTRRGTSNVFDGVWTHPNEPRIRGVLTVTVQGNEVYIRRELDPPNLSFWCNYKGTIGPDRVTVTGTYGCNPPYSGPYNWKAKITY